MYNDVTLFQGSSVNRFLLEIKSGSKDWEVLTHLPPNISECEIENMTSQTDYVIRVRAENKHGIGEAAELRQPIRVTGVEKRSIS